MLKPTQQRYITERLNEILRVKQRVVEEHYVKKVNKLYADAVKDKEFTVEKEYCRYNGKDSYSVKFPKLKAKLDILETENNELSSLMHTKMQRIKDDALLGDVEDALKALREFEAVKV